MIILCGCKNLAKWKCFLAIEYKMADVMDVLYGPLGRDYCIWFYALSILGFLSLFILVVSTLYYGVTKKKGLEFYLMMIPVALGYAIFYFQNRLLYSMCSGKMK